MASLAFSELGPLEKGLMGFIGSAFVADAGVVAFMPRGKKVVKSTFTKPGSVLDDLKEVIHPGHDADKRPLSATNHPPGFSATPVPKRHTSNWHRQKFVDTLFVASSVSTTGSLSSSLCLLAQGVGQSERLGIHIFVTQLHIKYAAFKLLGVDNAKTSGVLRILVLLDHQCNGALPAVTDILASATYLAFHKITEYGRFTLLHEEMFSLTSNPGASVKVAGDPASTPITPEYGGTTHGGDIILPLGLRVSFADAGGTVASITSSNLLILAITDLAANIDLRMNCRIRYEDD